MVDLLSLTVYIPFLNEEHNLQRCLKSIVAQDYPRDRLEVVLADGGSSDGSVQIIERFKDDLNITILDNSDLKEAEWGKAKAIDYASGELVQSIDADMWMSSRSMLSQLARPLSDDPELAAAVAPYAYSKELSVWSRFLSMDEFQRDPLYQKLTPSMEQFVVEDRGSYKVCRFDTTKVPPMGGTTMYRRKTIDLQRWNGSFNDIDQIIKLIEEGNNRVAYVDSVGWFHEHCTSLGNLMKKRRRNLVGQSNSYLKSDVRRDFEWLDTSNRTETLRLVGWIVGTNLLIPRAIEGFRQYRDSKKIESLLRPIVAVAVTDSILYGVLSSEEGHKMIKATLSGKSIR
jgi:glycosyltransferase involved in cell wall biosynthesis